MVVGRVARPGSHASAMTLHSSAASFLLDGWRREDLQSVENPRPVSEGLCARVGGVQVVRCDRTAGWEMPSGQISYWKPK